MQGLTVAPREHLTDEQVSRLLRGHLQVSAGLDLLNADLEAVEDVSDHLLGGSVSRNMNRTPHGACRLLLDREFSWGTDLLRPRMTLTGSGVTATFYCGVYALTTPERSVGADPVVFDVQGHDRLHLLQREVGDTYEVAAGTEVLQAVRDAITDADLSGVLLDGSAAGVLLPASMVWPLRGESASSPATWLRVVNDLLASINYRGVWADYLGRFRSEPYVSPSDRTPEWAFDADEPLTQVGEQRTVNRDVWGVPNRWVFVQKNLAGDPPPEPVVGAGLYVVDNVNGTVLGVTTDASVLTSQDARGLVWPKQYEYDASTQATLEALGVRRVLGDLRTVIRYAHDTSPFPVAGHADVFTYRDVRSGADTVVQAVEWSYDLTGGDVRWTWEGVA